MAGSRFRASRIVDGAGKLIGIITTATAVRARAGPAIREAMTKEKLVTAPIGTNLDEAERILASTASKAPRRRQQGVLKGLITIKDIFQAAPAPDPQGPSTAACGSPRRSAARPMPSRVAAR